VLPMGFAPNVGVDRQLVERLYAGYSAANKFLNRHG
jgi:hypothetical protein